MKVNTSSFNSKSEDNAERAPYIYMGRHTEKALQIEKKQKQVQIAENSFELAKLY